MYVLYSIYYFERVCLFIEKLSFSCLIYDKLFNNLEFCSFLLYSSLPNNLVHVLVECYIELSLVNAFIFFCCTFIIN